MYRWLSQFNTTAHVLGKHHDHKSYCWGRKGFVVVTRYLRGLNLPTNIYSPILAVCHHVSLINLQILLGIMYLSHIHTYIHIYIYTYILWFWTWSALGSKAPDGLASLGISAAASASRSGGEMALFALFRRPLGHLKPP